MGLRFRVLKLGLGFSFWGLALRVWRLGFRFARGSLQLVILRVLRLVILRVQVPKDQRGAPTNSVPFADVPNGTF